MGVTYEVTCLDCGEEGPEVGDLGYIGYPSLSEEEGGRFLPNFGFIYRGLVMLGMRTQAIEGLRAFLMEHRDHQMDISCEGESMFGEDGDEEELGDENGEDDEDEEDDERDEEDEGGEDEGDDEDDEEAEGKDEDDDAERQARADPKGFVASHFEASCSRCGASVRSEWEDRVIPFEARVLEKREVREALRRVTGEESFERASEPFGPDDFQRICGFLHKHAGHGPRIALIPKAAPSRP
jgi:hypothetical protein